MKFVGAVIIQIVLFAGIYGCAVDSISTADDIGDTSASCADSFPESPVQEDGYYPMQLCGWNVQMSTALYDNLLAKQVHKALSADLFRVQSSLPTPAIDSLKSVVFWLELDEPEFPGGVYHPSSTWLSANGYPVKWAKGVQLGNAKNYLSWVKEQPAMVLHELVHAYDDQTFNNSNLKILAAFEQAVQSGDYEAVQYVDSNELKKAYALSNAKEYFAEISEAYFWQNDFYPFNRSDLKQHDAAGYAAIESAWGI